MKVIECNFCVFWFFFFVFKIFDYDFIVMVIWVICGVFVELVLDCMGYGWVGVKVKGMFSISVVCEFVLF